MNARFDAWRTQREAAEILPCGLRVFRYETAAKRLGAILWAPKAMKPFTHRSFGNDGERSAFIATAVENHNKHRAAIRARRNAPPGGDLSLCDPGAVFSYSYGYDQTNVEYWQVVERRNTTAYLRQIEAERLPESVTSMTERVRAKPDVFLEAGCGVVRASGYRCNQSSQAALHAESCRAFDHAYEPGEPKLLRKRIQWSDGRPVFSMTCGTLFPVAVHRFGNAPALVIESEYTSSYH